MAFNGFFCQPAHLFNASASSNQLKLDSLLACAAAAARLCCSSPSSSRCPAPPSGVTHAAVKPWKDSTGAYRFAGSLTDCAAATAAAFHAAPLTLPPAPPIRCDPRSCQALEGFHRCLPPSRLRCPRHSGPPRHRHLPALQATPSYGALTAGVYCELL